MSANRPVKSDETMFAIIEMIRDLDGAGVTELADQVGMSKASIHHHLTTMQDHGFVTNVNGTYNLGLKFFALGIEARNRYTLYHAAKPELPNLADRVQEAVWTYVETNGIGMFIDGCAENSTLKLESVVGTTQHLHCCAIGKAILAHLPESRVEEIIDQHGLPERTENTITEEAALWEELETVRERGYALNLGEDIEGIHAAGVPVMDGSEVIGALGTGGPANRLDREYCETKLVEELLTSVNEIELNLAYN